ncbi:MAG: 8-amino-7-oxononanoate synthase [Spirochaetota bacterium]|nr:8-amino-7-oxononanoate synthase [Spirochaetota bacterium]
MLQKVNNTVSLDQEDLTMSSILDQLLKPKIDSLKEIGLYRSIRSITGPVEPTVIVDGKEVILLSSNNYLGFANHPELKRAAMSAIKELGTGSGGSRLISGNLDIHQELESRIAEFKQCEAGIIFSTGYMTNVGLITSLVGKGDLIISDELNHTSIIDGCRLSKADIKIFPHKDIESIMDILIEDIKLFNYNTNRKRVIITDGVFSMDGDIAPLSGIIKLAEEYNVIVIVDDAHGTGVLGENGRGTAEHFGLKSENLILMGTFSKALGSLGGYVVGPSILIDYLRNTSRSFIYSTSQPPSICASSIAAINLIEREPNIRKTLWDRVNRFKKGLLELGFDIMGSETQIVPIIIGDSHLTMEFAKAIIRSGVYAPGIRPPTVPEGVSRIRVSLMASHTNEQIDKVLTIFAREGQRLNII